MSAKKRKPGKNWQWQPEESAEKFQAEVSRRTEAPYASVQEATDFAANIAAVAVKRLAEANTGILAADCPDMLRIWEGERAYAMGVRAAATWIERGTTRP